jgi:acetolactate synthase-1/2/3 large subunit
MANAAQVLARGLFDAGCRHAFGMPGGEVLTVMDALVEAGIRFHLVKHENAGGYMAEGTYHMTGAPGVLLATLGPGMANAVNVIANAEQERVPLIYVTGCVDRHEAVGYSHQVFDHRAVLKPITKATFMAEDGALDTLIERALAIATEGRPGPVHIDLPVSLAAKQQPGARQPAFTRPAPAAPAEGPALRAAREALAMADRPLMVAGPEAVIQGAEATLARFARDFAIPVITTYKAKGVLPEDDPLALGAAGLSPLADAHLMPLVETADLILLAGYDPIEMRRGWCDPWDPERVPVIEFSAAPNAHGVHRVSHGFVGHIGAGLDALRDGVAARATWSNGAPAAARRALAEAFGGAEAWGPAAIVDEVRAALPEDGVATVDSGAHRILLSQTWRCPRPRTLLQSSALGSMGCALPLAIGAKLAAPDKPVVAFTGDAGLEMVLGELATLRDLELPVVIVVFVDASLALIELKQRQAGFANLGVDFGMTDFAAVARALGGRGLDVRSRGALSRAVGEGLAAETFTVIAAQIERGAYDGRF